MDCGRTGQSCNLSRAVVEVSGGILYVIYQRTNGSQPPPVINSRFPSSVNDEVVFPLQQFTISGILLNEVKSFHPYQVPSVLADQFAVQKSW